MVDPVHICTGPDQVIEDLDGSTRAELEDGGVQGIVSETWMQGIRILALREQLVQTLKVMGFNGGEKLVRHVSGLLCWEGSSTSRAPHKSLLMSQLLRSPSYGLHPVSP